MAQRILPEEKELNPFLFPAAATDAALTVIRCNAVARAMIGSGTVIKRLLKRAGARESKMMFSVQEENASFLVLTTRWEKEGAQGPLFFFLEDPLSALPLPQDNEMIAALPRAAVLQKAKSASLSPALRRTARAARLREDKEHIAAFFALQKTEEMTPRSLRLDRFFQSLLPLIKKMDMACRITCAPTVCVRAMPDAFCQTILYVLAFFRWMESDRIAIFVKTDGAETVIDFRATDPQEICARWKDLFFDRQAGSESKDGLFFSPLLFAALCAKRDKVKIAAFPERKNAVIRLCFPSALPEESSFFSVPAPQLSVLFEEMIRNTLSSGASETEKDKKLM